MWIGRALPVHDLFYFYNKEGINVKSSGIGGQAVIEGVMMRNKDRVKRMVWNIFSVQKNSLSR